MLKLLDRIASGDEVADKAERDAFIKNYDLKNSLVRKTANTAILQIGPNNWSMAIPVVKKESHWVLDTVKGKQEILNRRIERNEQMIRPGHVRESAACKNVIEMGTA
jgi:hypothetical protein